MRLHGRNAGKLLQSLLVVCPRHSDTTLVRSFTKDRQAEAGQKGPEKAEVLALPSHSLRRDHQAIEFRAPSECVVRQKQREARHFELAEEVHVRMEFGTRINVFAEDPRAPTDDPERDPVQLT